MTGSFADRSLKGRKFWWSEVGWHCVPEILGCSRVSVLEAQNFLQHQCQEVEPCWKSGVKPHPGFLPCTGQSLFPAQAFLQKTKPVSELFPWDAWLSPQSFSITKTNERFFFFCSAILLTEITMFTLKRTLISCLRRNSFEYIFLLNCKV